MEVTTTSLAQTKAFAKRLAQKYKDGAIIALYGELGAGKTSFVQGFAEGLSIKDKVISPTFVLMRIHDLPQSTSQLFHLDLYRLDPGSDFSQLGLAELISDRKNLVLIEWADRLGDNLPVHAIKIKLTQTGENSRRIEVIDPVVA